MAQRPLACPAGDADLAGLAVESEEGRIVRAWLLEDLARLREPPEAAALAAAVELGRFIYHSANDTFRAVYLDPEGEGQRWVRAAFRLRDCYPDEGAIEATLERIRDRWSHLRDDLRRKTQPSLFGPRTFDPARVRGYLRQVARFEGLHLAPDDQAWRRRALHPEALAAPATTSDCAAETDYGELARLLFAFYGHANGFTKAERLEAILSHGLGFLLSEADLAAPARAWLSAQLDASQPESVGGRLSQIDERVSGLLMRIHDLRHQVEYAWPLGRREQLEGRLARAEARLQLLQHRRHECLSRLRPTLREVAGMLQGFVTGSVGTLRYRRIEREARLLRRRVETGWPALVSSLAGVLPAWFLELGHAIVAHLAAEPMTRREHGLSTEQRQARDCERDGWLAIGRELLVRIVCLREEVSRPESWAVSWPVLLDWLTDAEAAYRFGAQAARRQRGVAGALGHWHGWRLAYLLRCA